MVRAILEKMKPAELRKYISAHNKVVRQYIGVEIKQARAAYSEKLKVKRRELKAAQQIDAKGKKKAELIELIMKEPALVRKIKFDDENKSFDPPAPPPKKEKKKPEPKKNNEQILEKAQKLVDELKKIDSEYSKSNLKKLFGGMSGDSERKKVLKVLQDWANSWKKLNVGKQSKVETLFEKIKKNVLEASEKYSSETIEEEKKPEAKKDKEERIKKLEKAMKKSSIQAKVKALGQKQVIKKRALAEKVEKTAQVLAKQERLNRLRKKVRELGKAEVEKKRKLADEIEKVAKELKLQKARAGKKPVTPRPPTPEPEETDDEDESPDPPIKAVPKRLHKVWKNYMEERVGDYYSAADQQEEIDDLKSAEKEYLQNEKIRGDTSVSASKQASARNANARTRKSMEDEFKTDSDIKKLYKEFAPRLLKKFEEFEKDLKKRKEADRKAEAAAAKEEIKFQEELAKRKQKEDEAEEKRIAKFQESERKRKEAAKKTASKEIKSSKK